MTTLHFLRPWWLLGFLPLLGLSWRLWKQSTSLETWAAICDSHLLEHLIQSKGKKKRHHALLLLLISAGFMVISLAGPTWSRLPVPTYQFIQPRVVILDLSDAMLAQDLLPDRLSRAKFKLHDLFMRRDIGQLGLIVYTSEPFVVSPLTNDAQTIDALMSSLTPDMMPVTGQRLEFALKQGAQLIHQAGFTHGQLLVLTADLPNTQAIDVANTLAKQSIFTSIMPVVSQSGGSAFHELAVAGKGQLLPLTDSPLDLEQWLKATTGNRQFSRSQQKDFPLWRDEGRWFLLPAFVFLLPVFRRGWLQRIVI